MADRRTERHQQTREEIVAAAWTLADDVGIAQITLRQLAGAVGMRAPSLYNYFPSKDALYDAMFEQANLSLAEAQSVVSPSDDPVADFTRGTLEWMAWCQASPARYQLLYSRAVPGWEPSPDAYASAQRVMHDLAGAVSRMGITSNEDIDLLVATNAGLIAQQMANDPKGDRWTRLAPRAIRMVVEDATQGARR